MSRPYTRENDLKRNASGAMDLTSFKATMKVDKERRKLNQFLKTIFNFANLAGYRIKIESIEDRSTNETVWKSNTQYDCKPLKTRTYKNPKRYLNE